MSREQELIDRELSNCEIFSPATPLVGQAVNHAPDNNEWPDPQPLISKVAPSPYPLEALPQKTACSNK